MDMDISMDIHAKSVDMEYGYGWKISYPRQPWLLATPCCLTVPPCCLFAMLLIVTVILWANKLQ